MEKVRFMKKYYKSLEDQDPQVVEQSKGDDKASKETTDQTRNEPSGADLDEEELDEERRLEQVRAKLEKTKAFMPKVNQHMVGYPG